MRTTIGAYEIDVDVAATRAFYTGAPTLAVPCSCPGCRNFPGAIRRLPQETAALLERLGIDPANPAEQWAECALDGGSSVLYGAFWHLCGTIVSGPAETGGTMEPVHISTRCGLVPQGFPEPVLQLDMHLRLPWVLAEQNTI